MVGGCRDAVEEAGDSDGVAVAVDEGRLVGGVVGLGLGYGGGNGEEEHDVDKMLEHEADYQDNHFRFQLVVQEE